MTLDDATIDRIAQRLFQLLRPELARTIAAEPRSGLLSSEQLQRELGVTRSTIEKLRKKGLPARMVGRCPRFDLVEVRAWLDVRSAPPTPAISDELPARRLGRKAG